MKNALITALFAVSLVLAQEPGHSTPPPASESHAAPAAQPHTGTAGHGEADKGAHEAGAAEHGDEQAADPNQIWWKWANFAILFGGLAYLAVKLGGPYFRERTAAIKSGIVEASRVREEAEARAAEIERRVSNLSVEVEHLRTQSKEEMVREAERVRAETAVQIAKVQAQAQSEIASAAKHATQELKAYAAQLALDLAERQISTRIDDGVQDGLADSFIRELKNKPGVN